MILSTSLKSIINTLHTINGAYWFLRTFATHSLQCYLRFHYLSFPRISSMKRTLKSVKVQPYCFRRGICTLGETLSPNVRTCWVCILQSSPADICSQMKDFSHLIWLDLRLCSWIWPRYLFKVLTPNNNLTCRYYLDLTIAFNDGNHSPFRKNDSEINGRRQWFDDSDAIINGASCHRVQSQRQIEVHKGEWVNTHSSHTMVNQVALSVDVIADIIAWVEVKGLNDMLCRDRYDLTMQHFQLLLQETHGFMGILAYRQVDQRLTLVHKSYFKLL